MLGSACCCMLRGHAASHPLLSPALPRLPPAHLLTPHARCFPLAGRGWPSTSPSCTTQSQTCWRRTRRPSCASQSTAASRSASLEARRKGWTAKMLAAPATTSRGWDRAARLTRRRRRRRRRLAPLCRPASGAAGDPGLPSSWALWAWDTTRIMVSVAPRQQAPRQRPRRRQQAPRRRRRQAAAAAATPTAALRQLAAPAGCP